MGNGGSTLRDKDIKFLTERTEYTKEQIKAWHEVFIKECPTGKISRRKFVHLYEKMFPDGKTSDFYQHMFRTFDSDKSGSLNFVEFMMAIDITERGKPEELLELAFRLYDIDGNGTIEMRELSEILRALYILNIPDKDEANEMYMKSVREVMRKLDVNRDGVLSKEEFVNGCMRDPEIKALLMGGLRHS